MRELILAVKAEAEKILESATNDDQFHNEQLQENERKRAHARDRIKACNDVLEAINRAAQQLIGNGK